MSTVTWTRHILTVHAQRNIAKQANIKLRRVKEPFLFDNMDDEVVEGGEDLYDAMGGSEDGWLSVTIK